MARCRADAGLRVTNVRVRRPGMVERTVYAGGEPVGAEAVAADMDPSKRFYGDVLGWTFVDSESEFGGYVLCLKNDKTVAALTPPMSEVAGPPVWNTYLKTSDANATAQRIDQAGGKLLMGPIELSNLGRKLVGVDLAGGAFGAWEPGNMIGAELYAEPGAITWAEVNT